MQDTLDKELNELNKRLEQKEVSFVCLDLCIYMYIDYRLERENNLTNMHVLWPNEVGICIRSIMTSVTGCMQKQSGDIEEIWTNVIWNQDLIILDAFCIAPLWLPSLLPEKD